MMKKIIIFELNKNSKSLFVNFTILSFKFLQQNYVWTSHLQIDNLFCAV